MGVIDSRFFSDDFSYAIVPSRAALGDRIIADLSATRKISIIGAAGQGKSTLCQYLRNRLKDQYRIYWFDWRDSEKECNNRLNSFQDSSEDLLLVDGYDELAESSRKMFNRLFRKAKTAKIIVSSRKRLSGFAEYSLTGLSTDDIALLLKRNYANANLDLSKIAQLAGGSPMLAILLGSVFGLNSNVISEIFARYDGEISLSTLVESQSSLVAMLAKQQYQKGNIAEALQLYELISLAVKSSKDIELLNDIAVAYREAGKYQDAMIYAQRALRLTEEMSDTEHAAALYNNIGSIYLALGDFDQALCYHQKALAIQQTLEQMADVALSYNNVGLCYYNMGCYDMALEFYTKSMEMNEQLHGANNPVLAASYGNIGSLYADMNDHERALVYYNNALEIQESALGQHPATATTYNNIGVLYLFQKRFSEAQAMLRKSYDCLLSTLGSNHSDTKIAKEALKEAFLSAGGSEADFSTDIAR